MEISMIVNGEKRTVRAAPHQRLLDVLRQDLGLTGTKEGCGKGECGACTVIMNGKPVASCLVLAPQAEGAEIETVENLTADDGTLHPLQESFIEKGAVQCGFCIPGILMTAKNLLKTDDNPGREQIRRALAGNICRCTGYQKIIDAVEAAADKIKRGEADL
ncbi:(2Fe-2S)-binding protein [Halarsenatibacter silvermanii]|uniref:Carbon-monoxide dehydrogenase small subunit n=1 Tax=Halarsenatibacter silvermanii TaxID=321763 RepID=A0A1G9IA68_9FIRM|nr:(2Fe-2S)-binding protein [Halarsenatibacter silvermanii]SDL21945.1 carbon-monoxide dehydrogenase small subunit [Halarsenatibacter silvermanii]